MAGILDTIKEAVTGSSTVSNIQDQVQTGVSAAAIWGVIVAVELFIIILLLGKKRGG